MIPTMIESHADGPQSVAALMHAPLNQLVAPLVAVFALAGVAGYLAYFVVAWAPFSKSAAIAAQLTTVAPPTVGQAPNADTLTNFDRRPRADEIAKAFRQATEDRQSLVAQDVVFDTYQPAIKKPVPLPKRRPPPRP